MVNKIKRVTKKRYSRDLISDWIKFNKNKIPICSITDHTLGSTLNVAFGSLEDFKKFLKDQHDQDITINDCIACYAWFNDSKGVTWHYMLIQDSHWYPQNYGTICHELHHFTHCALEKKGVDQHDSSEETFAYFQGYFMEMVIRAFMMLEDSTKPKKKVAKKKSTKKRKK